MISKKNLLLLLSLLSVVIGAVIVGSVSGQLDGEILIGPGSQSPNETDIFIGPGTESPVDSDIIVGPGTESPTGDGSGIGMANPAAVYCTQQGYESRDGRCYFPDGTSCEEWAFYNGECSYNPTPIIGPGTENPTVAFCTNKGFEYQDRTSPDGGEYGVCIFPDGTYCDAWEFYRGECQYNPKPTPDRYATYCKSKGYTWEDDGSAHGICVFPDGSYCDAVAFYERTCHYNPQPPKTEPAVPKAVYTCQAPPESDRSKLLYYDPNSSPPKSVYYEGSDLAWALFKTKFSAESPMIWVSATTGWLWNATCPLGGWVQEIVFIPQSGSVKLYEVYPGGTIQMYDLGQSAGGYGYIWFNAHTPGQYISLVTVDEVPSNAAIMEVKEDWIPCGSSTSSTQRTTFTVGGTAKTTSIGVDQLG